MSAYAQDVSFEEMLAALDAGLRRLPDRRAGFRVKQSGRYWGVKDRLPTIESHIRNHLKRLRHAVCQKAYLWKGATG